MSNTVELFKDGVVTHIPLPAFQPLVHALIYMGDVYLYDPAVCRYNATDSWEVRFPLEENPKTIHYDDTDGNWGDGEAWAACGKRLTRWYSMTTNARFVTCEECRKKVKQPAAGQPSPS